MADITREDVIKLINYVLDWWKKAQYDVRVSHGEEYNVYDNEPSFVVKAKLLRAKMKK